MSSTPIIIKATKDGDVESVRNLIGKGAYLDEEDNDHKTALYWATLYGDLEIVRLLCEEGANLDVKNDCGITALMLAAGRSNIEFARILCERGAVLDLQDNLGQTALHRAVRNGRHMVVGLLCRQQDWESTVALIDKKTTRGDTVFDIAIRTKQVEMASLIDSYWYDGTHRSYWFDAARGMF